MSLAPEVLLQGQWSCRLHAATAWFSLKEEELFLSCSCCGVPWGPQQLRLGVHNLEGHQHLMPTCSCRAVSCV